MKAVRGSNRAATKAPKQQTQHKARKTTVKPAAEDQESELSEGGQKTQQKPAKKRTGRRVQEDWQPISRSSMTAVENVLDLAILATVALRRTEKKESQEHLNTLKTRFLADCAKLKVPPCKQKYVECSSQRHQEETKKFNVGQVNLSALEEDLKSVVIALEKTEEQVASLQKECSLLKDQVEEEEEKAKEMLQQKEHCVLHIHFQPPEKDEPTLEAEMRKMLQHSDAEATARKLGEILRTSEASRAARELLLQAHRRADQILDLPRVSGTASEP